MPNTVTLFARSVINLIYPKRCANCGKDTDDPDLLCLCDICRGDIRQNPKPYCGICGRPVDTAESVCAGCRKVRFHFTKAYSAYIYDGAFKELIHLFKYRSRLSLSGPLAKLMTDFIKENPDILKDIDIITFVPLDNRRLRDRGFNQSKILASKISEESGIPLLDAMEKAVKTRHQNELSREERLKNLSGSFRLRRRADVAGSKILLIDDVMTTGSTLDECAKTLLDNGAESVKCLTLARGI